MSKCEHPNIGMYSSFEGEPPVFMCTTCGAEPVIYFEDDSHDEAWAIAMDAIGDVLMEHTNDEGHPR